MLDALAAPLSRDGMRQRWRKAEKLRRPSGQPTSVVMWQVTSWFPGETCVAAAGGSHAYAYRQQAREPLLASGARHARPGAWPERRGSTPRC